MAKVNDLVAYPLTTPLLADNFNFIEKGPPQKYRQATLDALKTLLGVTFDTRTLLGTATVDADVDIVRTGGYATAGDGGGGTYKRVGAQPSHVFNVQSADLTWWELVPDASGPDVRQSGAIGDGSTDNATAMAAFFNAESFGQALTVSQGTYLTGTGLISDDNLLLLAGKGAGRKANGDFIGSIIKANGTGVSDLLAIQSLDPTQKGSTNVNTIKITDFGLFHRGSGIGLLIDNITRCRIENIFIECNSEGAIGMKLNNFSFFATIENINIWNFTNVGLLITGDGSEHIIKSCHLNTTNDSAVAGLEITVPNFEVTGGQYNVDRADNGGIGILLNNTTGATIHGGVINNTLCERDIAVKLTGANQWSQIIIRDMNLSLSAVVLGVDFDNARRCMFINPGVNTPLGGGVLCQWGSSSTDCGLICDSKAATAPITVHANAIRPWKQVTGRITVAERDLVTTDSNITTTCEDVKGIGRNIHNGVAWDAQMQEVADNAAVSFNVPYETGTLEVIANAVVGGYILVQYIRSGGNLEILVQGLDAEIGAADGQLDGTTLTDGKMAVRMEDTGTGVIWFQNRLGTTTSFKFIFRTGRFQGAS